mgnify:FL=1
MYLVGIRDDNVRHPFSWPTAVKFKRTAKQLLNRGTDDKRLAIPPRERRRARDLVKRTYRTCMANKVDPRREVVFTDIGSSKRFLTYGVGVFPCITHGRAAELGWWASVVGRAVTQIELFRFQGLDDGDIDLTKLEITKPKVSARDVNRMIGNTMSLNVLERVLARCLWSAGLIAQRPVDRWVS